MWFIIGRAKTIVEELKEGDENKLAIYATLLIFKEKIELGYTIIKYLYNLIQKCREKRKENDEHDHGTKKEETKTPVV